MFIDEGGDYMKQHASQDKFKSIITERHIQLEMKGVNAIQLDSHHNFIMATNSSKAIKLTSDSRRFFYKRCVLPPWPKGGTQWCKLWAMLEDDDVIRWVGVDAIHKKC